MDNNEVVTEEVAAVVENNTGIEIEPLFEEQVDGQFIESQKDITLKFRGSANQRILDLNEK